MYVVLGVLTIIIPTHRLFTIQYNYMRLWAAAKRGPPPTQATLERITAEQTALYSQVPSPGENIPVTVKPAEIDDSVPTEDKIADAVTKLRRNRSGGPSRIRHPPSLGRREPPFEVFYADPRRPRGEGWRRRRGRRKRRQRRR